MESGMNTSGLSRNMFSLYQESRLYSVSASNENSGHLDVNNIRIKPKELIFCNPFEGKKYKVEMTIQNFGAKPVLVRILNPSSSALKVVTNVNPIFLCSGLIIKRTVSYKVQMVTLIQSCTIPIYIDDDCIEYKVRIVIHPVLLRTIPENLLDFGQLDASDKPAKRFMTIINDDERPTKFFFDLGPNEMDITIEPMRGIITGNTEIEVELSAIFENKGEFATSMWLISDRANIINIRATVGVNAIIPMYVPSTTTFNFIQFPSTYYGTSITRNVIMEYDGISPTFFCILGEIEMETYPLNQLQEEHEDYRFFSVNPVEGRFLANDTRVFQFTYTPNCNPQTIKQQHHLIMLRLRRTKCKDINPGDYNDNVFEDPETRHTSAIESDIKRISSASVLSDQIPYTSGIDIKPSLTVIDTLSPMEVRLMLYGQVEEVSVSVLPDEFFLHNLIVNETVTRVLQLTNNCNSLPIIFRYKKIAFVEVNPKEGIIEASQSVEVELLITPKSLTKVQTFVVFDLLHPDQSRTHNNLVVVGQIKVPFTMDEKIQTTTKSRHGCKNIWMVEPSKSMTKKLTFPKHLEKNLRLKVPNIPDNEPGYYDKFIKLQGSQITDSLYALTYPSKCYYRRDSKFKSIQYTSNEFIPLTPIQVAQVAIIPLLAHVENVAYDSTYIHTITIINKSNSYLQIFLRGRHDEYNFYDGNRFTVKPSEQKNISFMLYIGHNPVHLFEVDVIINSSFVCETVVIMKACPKHLTLDVEMLTFFENEPNSKFVELHNQLNVALPFQWKIPAVFKVDPMKGTVEPGRFVACMITFELGEAENMVYDLGVYTDNKYYNLRVLIEGTDYKLKYPKVLNFEELSLNVPCEKNFVLQNMTPHRVEFEAQDKELTGFKVKPREGYIIPYGTVHLLVCANCNELGQFNVKLEILIYNHKKITCELTGSVFFPELLFKPDVLRFRKMAASSFDIACVTIMNRSNVKAMIQFDVDRFPEFSYSEYTNVDYMTSKDCFYVNPKEEKVFSIHFYPYNPLVTSFMLPLFVNKMPIVNKAKVGFHGKSAVKIHAQVLSYKLEVKSWRYNFTYFPYFNHTNITSHLITISNPSKSVVTFCIRLDELAPPFEFTHVNGILPIYYECSVVVDLSPDEFVTFKACFEPNEPGRHSIRLPVYIRDDFNQDVHNYFNFVGVYPEATYKYPDDCIHIGFVPLRFTINKKIVIDMLYHHPNCNCRAVLNDQHVRIDMDNTPVSGSIFRKAIAITYNSAKSHLINSKLDIFCDCPGPNLGIDVYGGSENNYMTVHACIQYFRLTTNTSVAAMFEVEDTEFGNVSMITVRDFTKEDAITHSYKCDLPYFQSGTTTFDDYMRRVLTIFEQWIMEQVFFGVRSFTIPESICIPDIRMYEKQGRPEALIKVPLQLILNYLLGPNIMVSFEIKFTEKRPICVLIRRFYKEILTLLLSYGCFVNMLRPEVLLPYEMYLEYMTIMNRKSKILPQKMYYLLAKQHWLDLCMQLYKSFFSKRLLKNLQASTLALNSSLSYMSSKELNVVAPINFRETLFSEDGVLLLQWLNINFQEYKTKLVAASPGNEMNVRFQRRVIANFDEDLSDSLAIISCILTCCPFLEKHIIGVYTQTTTRIEQMTNAYILLKIISLLKISFHLTPMNILEPNAVQMVMFITYLYAFLVPLKNKDTIHFQVALSDSRTETITIMNESKIRNMYYNVVFFDNPDDLFTVNKEQVVVDVDSKGKLEITYLSKYLRLQQTVLLLSGEVTGYNYSNSKIYYLEGKPIVTSPIVQEIEVRGIVYRITRVDFLVWSPYPMKATYELFLINDKLEEIQDILDSAVPYSYLLKIKILTRCRFNNAFVESDPAGQINMKADLCNIVNTSNCQAVLFRSAEAGDFIARIIVISKRRRQFKTIHLKTHKALKNFPCTCPKKKPDINNSKCPRTFKVTIPSRNEDLWNAVMKFFLAGRDPEEEEFWNVFAQSQVGVHIVTRVIHNHKKFLHDDMTYFMEKKVTFNVHTRTPETVMTQKVKEIDLELANINSSTEILVHFNDIIESFYLELHSTDLKETRTYKVRVNYE